MGSSNETSHFGPTPHPLGPAGNPGRSSTLTLGPSRFHFFDPATGLAIEPVFAAAT